MDIDACINEYIDMAPEIFPLEGHISGSGVGRFMNLASGNQRFDPKPLQNAVKRLVKKHLGDKATAGEDTLLRFEASRDNKSPQCKMFARNLHNCNAELIDLSDSSVLPPKN